MTSGVVTTHSDAPALRAEAEAVYAAGAAGAVGALYGLVVALVVPDLPLADSMGAFGLLAAIGAAVVAGAASGTGYWRSRARPGQEWRRGLPSWKFAVNTVSVVIVHTALAFLAAYAGFRLLGLGFIGLPVVTFWAIVLMAVTLGLSSYLVYLSVSRVTTQRMSSLLMAFIVIGTLTAMVTSPDPQWWKVHFSQLGTFDDLSSFVFNGTLIAAGLLVTTFAVYIANDLQRLVAEGVLSRSGAPRIISTLFVIMGVMLAGVGIFPVDVSMPLHNVSASGMALIFLALLIAGPTLLRGMPRAYFVSEWAFLFATVATVVLFVIRYFTLTALEIIVFALIFGWIAVFVRFLAVSGQRGESS
ncbi:MULTISPECIES: DUF998 domain-containing protein [unclassified Microbacterium]|uniref:DUF998 domain-containing protein n=1 Tax=unclassified Microbacterium TaxID=2609290 RepID=UPI00214B7551|nr:MULTISPECIES: DUF998 domain-containing protein [unclassified Microbacterium]MCR2808194.1 DUF998 domain-containing protein [Microbacterium sp. zg.B185]WIM19344.1 DUF998 domain-containing protein [Microbacterium sp. zg-B185]